MDYTDDIERYVYRDQTGRVRYVVVREGHGPTKSFEIVDCDGRILPNPLPEAQRILYRLPELVAAATWETIFICEGEKDVDSLVAARLTATTMPCGTHGGWLDHYNGYFDGRHVCVLPDADRPGKRHAQRVCESLEAHAASVVTVPTGPKWYDDATTWLAKRAFAAEKLLAEVALARCRRAGLSGLPRRKPDKLHLIRSAQISTLAKLVLVLIVESNTPGNELRPSITDLARECGCHRVTLQKVITQFRKSGVLKRAQDSSGIAKNDDQTPEVIAWGAVAMYCPRRDPLGHSIKNC